MADLQRENHWRNAQRLELGVDLIAAARSQLRLLAAVDSHPLGLYGGPALDLAISRYENHWLPLLADHGPNNSSGLPLIPPLDCAWIWHCHRLNPVQYIKDCKAVYGKLLDPPAVPLGIENESIVQTQRLWNSQFPDEEYDIPLEGSLSKKIAGPRKFSYDLRAAVERQSSFYYQVSRPYVEDEKFLHAALQRYKGYLYLLKLSNLEVFLVPTYDIDLMWHSHQLCSGVYRDDTKRFFGRVLNHDDSDSDRSEGQKLDTGSNRTREFWHCTFGSSYERAGAMYRGDPPTLPRLIHWSHGMEGWPKNHSTRVSFEPIHGVQPRRSFQVCIRVFEARNLHISHDGVVAVRLLLKRKCSMLKLETSWMKWAHNTKWDDLWLFDCEESTEGLLLELYFEKERNCGPIRKSRLIGWTDISWQILLSSSTLSLNGWMPLIMKSHELDQKPTSLRVSVSITPPSSAPFMFQIDHSLLKNKEKNSLYKIVYDHTFRKSFIIEFKDLALGETWQPSSIQVYGMNSDESSGTLLGSAACARPAMSQWSLLDGDMHLSISSTFEYCQPDIELSTTSNNLVMLVHGRNCQYEISGSRKVDEAGYMTLVRQVQGAPVGKATALFNWKSGAMEISPDENAILVILLCVIVGIVADKSHFMYCNRKPLHKLKMSTEQNDWGAVVLNKHGICYDKNLLWFCPWYTMNAQQWLGMLYKADRGLLPHFKLCCGFSASDGCEGCYDGFMNGKKKGLLRGKGGRWGSGGCGACGAGGCGKSISKANVDARAGGCGACGSGGCGNGTIKANVVARAGGCGACGAGGCGNSLSKAKAAAHSGGCGACGAGGCGNSICKENAVGRAGGCGACGAGGCGNSISKANAVAYAGGCGACGAGGCGNSTSKANAVAHAGGCGACGAGGCGNGLQDHNPSS